VGVFEHGRVDLRRVMIEEATGLGALVAGEGGVGRLTDIHIVRVQPKEGDPVLGTRIGRGFQSQVGGVAEVERIVVDEARDSGIAVSDGTLTVRDARVRLTHDDGVAGLEGRGMHANGGVLNIERAEIIDNRHSGLAGFRSGRIVGRDIRRAPTKRAMESGAILRAPPSP